MRDFPEYRLQPRDKSAFCQILERENVKVVATDSGLGGLTIAADITEGLNRCRAVRQAHIIFFNCLPSESVGFDAMGSDKRPRVLSRALDAMAQRFSPDVILLACNTISAIYDQTTFAAHCSLPVLGIIEMGVDVVAEHLGGDPDGRVILFAARTTVETGVHKSMLSARGIPAGNVSYQECPGLIGSIERGPDSLETRGLIQRYVREAISALPDGGPIAAALLCTHFDYVEALFREELRTWARCTVPVLNPNSRMVDSFLAAATPERFQDCEITVEVVSQTRISEERREAIARTLTGRSERFARALQHYVHLPGMFAID